VPAEVGRRQRGQHDVVPTNSSRNSGTLVARASTARSVGNGDWVISRTWTATSAMNPASPISKMVTAARVET
jgi:hypothetical protein